MATMRTLTQRAAGAATAGELLGAVGREPATGLDEVHAGSSEGDSPSLEAVRSVDSLLDGLSAPERQTIDLLFGLTGEAPMSLEAVGQRSGLAADEVMAVCSRALARLRLPRPRNVLSTN